MLFAGCCFHLFFFSLSFGTGRVFFFSILNKCRDGQKALYGKNQRFFFLILTVWFSFLFEKLLDFQEATNVLFIFMNSFHSTRLNCMATAQPKITAQTRFSSKYTPNFFLSFLLLGFPFSFLFAVASRQDAHGKNVC